MKEGERKFSIPLYWLLQSVSLSSACAKWQQVNFSILCSMREFPLCAVCVKEEQEKPLLVSPTHPENAVKGEKPTGVEGWLHGGAILVTVCFKSRIECPCMNPSKCLGGWMKGL